MKFSKIKKREKFMRVLIFGLGLNQGGVGSALFFAKKGTKVRVTDLKSKEILKTSLEQLKGYSIEYTLGEHKNEDIEWADLIIKNPAVKPNNPYLEYALKNGKRVEQDMGIFLDFVKPSQIIGVTGTKGKSTTASLIYEVLKLNNTGDLKVILAGNIGTSVLDVLEQITANTLVVLELSSFQLEAFEKHQVSPKWSVITNIYPDHLNYYKNMEEYILAKKVIGLYQNPDDFLFINKDAPIISSPNFLKGLKGKIIYYSSSDLPKNFHSILMGEHNKSNITAALSVGKTFNIDKNSILDVLSKFKGVPFRMELIKEWKGVKIYNDTTATGPDAGIQAIKTGAKLIHPPGGLVLICGGMNKRMDYTKYAKILSSFVQKVFFLEGDSTEIILNQLQSSNSGLQLQIFGSYHDFEKLLTEVKSQVKSGDIILFSPAATSFNLFQNEFDRGRKFNEAVQKVFGDG